MSEHTANETLLEMSGINKTFSRSEGDIQILEDFSLSLQKGECVAVRGPSGSGKTTFLLIAGGLLKPDSGTVKCMGEDMYALSPEKRARFRGEKIGFVFQQYHLLPYLSVTGNILVPQMRGDIENVRERAADLEKRLGIDHRAGHVPGELSVGERQRTAFARAVIHEPDILLVDEPTGNLDKPNADILLNFLREFAEKGGGVLMATHDQYAVTFTDRQIPVTSKEPAVA